VFEAHKYVLSVADSEIQLNPNWLSEIRAVVSGVRQATAMAAEEPPVQAADGVADADEDAYADEPSFDDQAEQ